MARANLPTWLPLDTFAAIVGVHPLHFNQLYSASLQEGLTCGQPWFQYAWQAAHRVSREDVANAIYSAERKIASFVGYNLIPDWTALERHQSTRPLRKEGFSTGLNIRGMTKSVRAEKGYIISGGQRAKSLIEADATVSRSDEDGDLYEEMAAVTVLNVPTDITNACEIHVYLPGRDGADEWEIRPVRVSLAGTTASIIFNSWQIVDPVLQEALNAKTIDADDDGNYLDEVDVYRVYNDPSLQVRFIWENSNGLCGCGNSGCDQCTISTQYGCLVLREERIGILAYHPGTWDADSEAFQANEYSVGRDPDQMLLWYYSGWRDGRLPCTHDMDNYWARAVAYYAASLLDRQVCDCNNVSVFIDHWREDLAKSVERASYQVSPSLISSLFGTTRGAAYAYNCCLEPGRKIGR